MDLALAIFNIGAGIGVLAAGGALVYLAWQLTPLIRESRALSTDLRRLARVTDHELRPILTHTREVAANVEVLSEDAAVKLDRLNDLLGVVQHQLETAELAPGAGRPGAGSVESSQMREDAADR